MKVIFFILELSFIISKEPLWLDYGYIYPIDSLEKTNNFYTKLKIYDRLKIFIFLKKKSKNLNLSITFNECDKSNTFTRNELVPFIKTNEGGITTFAAEYIGKDIKTDHIRFEIASKKEIEDVTILATIKEYNASKSIEKIDLNEGEITNLNEFNSKNIYQFTLKADYNYYNSYARLELIFDAEDCDYKNFYLPYFVEYQNDKIQKIFNLQVTDTTTQGNKIILTFRHQITDEHTTKVIFQLVPSYDEHNVNILGFKDKAQNEFLNLDLGYSLELISMYSSINYKLIYPVEAYQTGQIQLRFSNIISSDKNSQNVDIYECSSKLFETCKIIIKNQNFSMTENNSDSTIFLEFYYQNNNDSINHIAFAFNPLYNFYNVSITGSIWKNDSDQTPDSDSGSSSDSAPDSGSSSFSVLISIIISIIIISVIVFFIYLYIKKRRSKDINFDQRDSLGDDFLLNE